MRDIMNPRCRNHPAVMDAGCPTFLYHTEVGRAAPLLDEINHTGNVCLRCHPGGNRQLAPRVPIRQPVCTLKHDRLPAHHRIAAHQTRLIGEPQTCFVHVPIVRRQRLINLLIHTDRQYPLTDFLVQLQFVLEMQLGRNRHRAGKQLLEPIDNFRLALIGTAQCLHQIQQKRANILPNGRSRIGLSQRKTLERYTAVDVKVGRHRWNPVLEVKVKRSHTITIPDQLRRVLRHVLLQHRHTVLLGLLDAPYPLTLLGQQIQRTDHIDVGQLLHVALVAQPCLLLCFHVHHQLRIDLLRQPACLCPVVGADEHIDRFLGQLRRKVQLCRRPNLVDLDQPWSKLAGHLDRFRAFEELVAYFGGTEQRTGHRWFVGVRFRYLQQTLCRSAKLFVAGVFRCFLEQIA
uniref:Uncharacterized protein n=1 Tax=Anopheles melas TaxID=34690 RepID=A0A182U4Z0_9DIPT